MNRPHAALITTMLLSACSGPPSPPAATMAPSEATTASAPSVEAPPAPEHGHWSNIGGGIGYALQLEGRRGVLVECETGGHCAVFPVDEVDWEETALTMTVRYPGAAQVWKARYGLEGRLHIEGGIWRAQTLFDCTAARPEGHAPAYLCPQRLPLDPASPSPEYRGRLSPGPGAPDWRPITSWPAGVAGILWGQETTGADACAPVLEPPADAGHGWSRFWIWRVYDPTALTEYAILHRILVWGGKTQRELSVVQRPALAAWQAGAPRFATTFMTYHPPAPRDIHAEFRIHSRMTQSEARPALRSRGLIDRTGEALDFTYAMERHRKGAPLQAAEHLEIGIGPAEGTEVACRPEELGVLAGQRYRMRDVSRGTDSYGTMGDLLRRLAGG